VAEGAREIRYVDTGRTIPEEPGNGAYVPLMFGVLPAPPLKVPEYTEEELVQAGVNYLANKYTSASYPFSAAYGIAQLLGDYSTPAEPEGEDPDCE
jgi:hypothetical protein